MNLFIKNSLSGVLQLLLTACLTFYSIPLFIEKLGAEAYGIYAVVGIVGNLSVVVNLGLNTSLLRLLGQQGKCRESDHDILTTLSLLTIVLLPLSSIAYCYRQSILLHILGLSGKMYQQAEGLYIGVLAANVLLVVGQTFTTMLDALQRTYIVNMYQFMYGLLYWIGNIIIIHLGFGLNEVGISIFFSAIVWFVIVFWSAIKYWGIFDLKGFSSSAIKSFHKQIKYGANVYSAGILSFLYEPLTKLLLSQFFGVIAVGYYDIASRIKMQVYGIASRALYPLYPWLTRQSSITVIRDAINQVQYKLIFLLIPASIFTFYYLPTVMSFWLQSDSSITTWTTTGILLSYLLFSIPVIPVYHFLVAQGWAKKAVIVQLINVLINILCIIFLKSEIGFYSVVIGHFTAQFFSFIYLQHCQNKYLGNYALTNRNQLIHLCQLAIILSIILSIIHACNLDSSMNLMTVPIATFITCILFYRNIKFIHLKELEQIVGKRTITYNLLKKVFTKTVATR